MSKRKLTPAQKKEKKRRKRLYKTVFMNGKQVRVRREQESIDPLTLDDITLHQLGMWEVIHEKQMKLAGEEEDFPFTAPPADADERAEMKDNIDDSDIPF